MELIVPSVGESITEVELGEWLKKEGESVARDETIVLLESEKATVEFPAPESGVLIKILKRSGETAKVGEVIATLDTQTASSTTAAPPAPAVEPKKPKTPEAASPRSRTPASAAPPSEPAAPTSEPGSVEKPQPAVSPPPTVSGPTTPPPVSVTAVPLPESLPPPITKSVSEASPQDEEVVPLSYIRRKVAERLVEAQHQAALLTTFNEIDLGEVNSLRASLREAFQERYKVKLGFMSFFVKAVVDALKLVPQLNAEIRGNDIVFKKYHDIGVAIGGGRGLVVPVLRQADHLSFAEIETTIADFAARAANNALLPEELLGGTFTITNGGVYGSLLSTPIINPPQSGILGMHTIQERPVARNGAVVIRPMMYVALTYDHRLVDGREAVAFLVRVKDCIENPSRMLLEV